MAITNKMKLVSFANLQTFLAELKKNLTVAASSEAGAGKFVTSVSQADGKVSATYGTVATSAVTGLDAKLASLDAAIESAGTAAELTITTPEVSDKDVLKTYVFTQGSAEVGRINIPKDFLVRSGSVVDGDEGKVIRLVLNTMESDGTGSTIDINVGDLVDEYTAGNGVEITSRKVSVKKAAGSESYLTVDANGVSVTGIDAIKTTAESAIKSVKVNGTALSPDTAKAVDVKIIEGTTNGAISVNGKAVNVHGLGSAAYTSSDAYDTKGSASSAQAAAIAEAAADAKTKADKALEDAKSYVDGQLDEVRAGASKIDKILYNKEELTITNKQVDLADLFVACTDDEIKGMQF